MLPSLVLPTLGPRPFQTGRGQQRARAPQRHHPPPRTCSDASFYRDGMHFGLFILLSLPISVGAGAELPRPRAVNTIAEVTQTHAPLKPAPHRPSRRNSRSPGLGIHRSQSIISSQQGGNVGKKVTSEIARSHLQNRGGISKARNLLMKKKTKVEKSILPTFIPFLSSCSGKDQQDLCSLSHTLPARFSLPKQKEINQYNFPCRDWVF